MMMMMMMMMMEWKGTGEIDCRIVADLSGYRQPERISRQA
jgi:hypothetical protein